MYGNLLRGSRESSRPTTGCKAVWSATGRREPKPSMNGREKSDSLIVPTKPTNKTGQPAAEPVEGSNGTERNVSPGSTSRTQCRGIVTQEWAHICGVVKHTDVRALSARFKVRAVCLNWARTDRCGGRLVRAFPTAIMQHR